MPATVNRQIVLKRRPTGAPTPDDFALVEAPMPRLEPGQVLSRTIYLSLDPYMRGRMREGRSYAKPVDLGQVMVGGTVSQVVESQQPGFAVGDPAHDFARRARWQQCGVPEAPTSILARTRDTKHHRRVRASTQWG
jgi:hypothetical protein